MGTRTWASVDDTVVVIGAGPVGIAHAAIARLEGAGQVMLLEFAAHRLELAREILGDERMSYVDVSSADSVATVRDATDQVGAEVVIVASSSAEAQEQAMEMAAVRGRVLFFGGLPKGPRTSASRPTSCTMERFKCSARTPPATATRSMPWTCSPPMPAGCAA